MYVGRVSKSGLAVTGNSLARFSSLFRENLRKRSRGMIILSLIGVVVGGGNAILSYRSGNMEAARGWVCAVCYSGALLLSELELRRKS